ncbi:hypothetical protein BM536_005190 [Streptomyces phaeoluteigriseus]|uniref:Dynamin N-terminal domain-containing protein n=1 Tax=Streptomyces phaeoluteigriseus TaxID=114686 RepID=A0A1V6MYD0_9ACTN|nr:hypothetical protein BM536_005190 [Streptomyces phaeoluteigriseus]
MAQPMRIAVAGQIKRGKSTLVNALLGDEVCETGQLELTFNVSEFHHAEQPRLLVHFKDGRPVEEWPPDALSRLTVRDAGALRQLRAIRKVEVAGPARCCAASGSWTRRGWEVCTGRTRTTRCRSWASTIRWSGRTPPGCSSGWAGTPGPCTP